METVRIWFTGAFGQHHPQLQHLLHRRRIGVDPATPDSQSVLSATCSASAIGRAPLAPMRSWN
jgi:hypothetical protein